MSKDNLPNWLFKVAANTENGGGHISRSLILARTMNARIIFMVPDESPYRSLIATNGFSMISKDDDLSFYDGIWMDVYHADFNYFRSKTNCLAIIEDHKDLYEDADIYVRPFPGHFQKNPQKTELVGFDYALIDEKFFSKDSKPVSKDVETITVFMGRYDSANATYKVLETLNTLEQTAKIKVIMGNSAAHLDAVKNYLEHNFSHNYQLYIDVLDISDIFHSSDLLILSGGVSLLEACALGTPAVVLNIADNQILLSDHCSHVGAIAYAGHISKFNQKDFSELLDQAMTYPARQKMSLNATALVRKSGADEIASILTNHSMKGAA